MNIQQELTDAPEPVPVAWLPGGFRIEHFAKDDPILTDEANAERRFFVTRIEPPYHKDGVWFGATAEDALAKACAAIGVDYANAPPAPSAPDVAQTIPSHDQITQILNGLDRCGVAESKRAFLRTWIRDWTAHKLSAAPTPAEAPADVARDAEPVAYFTGYNNGYPTIAPINPALCMAIGTALYSAPPAPSAPDKTSCLSTGGMTVWGDSVSIEKCNNFVHLASQAAGFKDELINTRAELRQQRGKLLVALEKCRDMVGHPDNIAFIDAAIAEVKGPK